MSAPGLITEIALVDPVEFRVPDLNGYTEVERILARVNVQGSTEAESILSRLVPGHRFDLLAQDVDAGRFSAQPHASVHDQIDGLALLEELTRQAPVQAPGLKVVRDQLSPPEADYLDPGSPPLSAPRLRSGGLANQMKNGYSLIFNFADLHVSLLAQLAVLFERIFLWPININVYVGYSEHDAFGFHWDDHEVIILPLYGQKAWEVAPPSDLSKVEEIHAGTSQDTVPAWSKSIEPGWSLHIPRGWPHRVRACGELTVHATVTIPRARAIDVLRLAADGASEDLGSRSVTRSSSSMLSWPGMFGSDATVNHLRSILHEGFERSYERTVVRRRISMPARRVGSLRGLIHRDMERIALRNPYGGGWMIGAATESGSVSVGAGGRHWTCHPSVVDVLGLVSGIRPVPLRELGDGLDSDLMTTIIGSGMLDVVDDDWRPAW